MLIAGQTSDEFELFNTNMNSGSSHACNCRGSSQTVAYYVKQECDNVEQCPIKRLQDILVLAQHQFCDVFTKRPGYLSCEKCQLKTVLYK